MPLYRSRIAQELEVKKSEFSGERSKEAIEEYSEAAEEISSELSKDEIVDRLQDREDPGALPTEEFDAHDGLIVSFPESGHWTSHEAVNQWARDQLEGVTTIAADGSQIDPVTEFEQPVGLVQVVWLANDHLPAGGYEEDAETVVLTPDDLLFENPNSGYIQVDEQKVPVTRFETEVRVLEKQIKRHSDDKNPPVVMYDGSLILSFIQMFDQKTQKRYADALSRLLAASKHHEVPVVGYVAGSDATEIGDMIQNANLVDTNRPVRDYQFLPELMENWGDRTVLFSAHRDQTQNMLRTTYHGQQYDFSDRILFTYMDIGPGSQLDRVALPAWIHSRDMTEYVLTAVRAEAGVGRGYPEILQTVDADAVIRRQEREEFLRMYQDFSDEHNIELQWDNKALNKKRRRR